MTEQAKVPEIRFAGFTDPWEQRKLGEFSKKNTIKNANGALSETFTNSAEQGVISQLDYFDHDITNDANISGYYVVQPDDFVYNPRISATAPCGPINRNRLNRAGVMSPLYTVFSVDASMDKTYLEHYFKTSRWHDFMFLEGNTGARSDRFSISDATFFEMPIWCPEISEQMAIAKQLETTDTLITLHQRKYDKLVVFKKSMLEKMFPKDGESVPEIRFAGFTDPWEQRKLGELITELSSGKSVNSEKGAVGPSDIGILKTSCVSYDMFDPTECKRVVDAETRMVSCPVEAGTLIVSRMNTPDRVGACGFVPGDRTNLFLPDRLWKVKLTPEVDPYLIFVLLVSASYKARLKGMASGTSGSMHNIPKDSFGNLDVTLPRESKEQRTIGSMFEQLDNLITLHQRKLELLRNIKKSLLDKMFV